MDKKTHDRGLEIRKAVLGEAYVANALKNSDDFNKPFLVTEYCWGAIWGREELPRKTRRTFFAGFMHFALMKLKQQSMVCRIGYGPLFSSCIPRQSAGASPQAAKPWRCEGPDLVTD